MLGDIQNKRLIIVKGFLFLLCGILAGGMLLADTPSLRTALLLVLCVWCFCRFYYFAFYVIQHYVDDTYRFAGLWSFVRFLMRSNKS